MWFLLEQLWVEYACLQESDSKGTPRTFKPGTNVTKGQYVMMGNESGNENLGGANKSNQWKH